MERNLGTHKLNFSYWFFFYFDLQYLLHATFSWSSQFLSPSQSFSLNKKSCLCCIGSCCIPAIYPLKFPITSTGKLFLFFIKMNYQSRRTKYKPTANSTTSNHSLHAAETPPCPAQDNNPISLSQDSRIYGVLVKFGLWKIQIKAVSKQAKVGKVWRGEVVTPALTSCWCF